MNKIVKNEIYIIPVYKTLADPSGFVRVEDIKIR